MHNGPASTLPPQKFQASRIGFRWFRTKQSTCCFTIPPCQVPGAPLPPCQDYITHLFTGRRIMAKELNFLKQLPDSLKKEVDLAEVTCHEISWDPPRFTWGSLTMSFLPIGCKDLVDVGLRFGCMFRSFRCCLILARRTPDRYARRQSGPYPVEIRHIFEMDKSVVDISYHFMTFPGQHGPYIMIGPLLWGNHGPFSRNNALQCRGGSSLCLHCGFWTRQRSSAGDRTNRVHEQLFGQPPEVALGPRRTPNTWHILHSTVSGSKARDIHKKPRELVGHPLIIDEACLEKEEQVLSHLTVITATWKQRKHWCCGHWYTAKTQHGTSFNIMEPQNGCMMMRPRPAPAVWFELESWSLRKWWAWTCLRSGKMY